MCGASLEGKVLAVEGEDIKLHLSIDGNQDEGEGSRFKYAPPTGNTMYSMLVVGTSARLYFPDESRNEPLVSGCVRSNGISCAKTSDTTKRYFGTEHGSELEMTPSALNIKINGASQINALKSNTQSGFSLETDLHFLSDNIIKNGSSSESYPDFDDEPQVGQMPEPEPPKEEEKGFNWGLLAVVASVATFGLATTVGVMAIGAIAGSAVVGAYKGAKNSIESQKAANGDVDCLEVIKTGFTGAVTGAKDMVITEACVAYDTLNQTASSIFDICTCGTFHNECEDFSEWSHKFFKDKAPYKNSYEFEQYLLNVALIADGAVKFGNMIDGISSGGGGFTLAFEGGYGESFAGAVPSIAAAGELGSMAVGVGAFYNAVKNGSSSNSSFNDFNAENATNKQKGNYGEYKSEDNLINNEAIKKEGYDLESVGRDAPATPNDKIVKGIDGLYKNKNPNSNIKYVIDEAKFGSSKLGKTKDGLQMSDDWIKGNKRILKAVDGDEDLARKISKALDKGQVERVLSKIDSNGNVSTYRLDSSGKVIGIWP